MHRVEEPTVAVDAAPLNGSFSLRRIGERRVGEHRPSVAESPARPLRLRLWTCMVARHQGDRLRSQHERRRARSQAQQEPHEVRCRSDHPCAPGHEALARYQRTVGAFAARAGGGGLGRGWLRADAEGIGRGVLQTPTDSAALARYLGAIVQGMSVQAQDGATRQELLAIADIAVRTLRQSTS